MYSALVKKSFPLHGVLSLSPYQFALLLKNVVKISPVCVNCTKLRVRESYRCLLYLFSMAFEPVFKPAIFLTLCGCRFTGRGYFESNVAIIPALLCDSHYEFVSELPDPIGLQKPLIAGPFVCWKPVKRIGD